MSKTIQRVLAVVLTIAMLFGLNGLAGTTKENSVHIMPVGEQVNAQVQVTTIPEDTLEEIGEVALEDGEKAAEMVNQYTDEVDYQAALNQALTSYYENKDFDQLDEFKAAADDRADEAFSDYKKAAKERAKGTKNGFEPGKLVAFFKKGTTKKEIEKICKAQNGTLDSYYEYFDGSYLAEINISLGQTVDMATEEYGNYEAIKAADGNDLVDAEDENIGSENPEDILRNSDGPNWDDYQFEQLNIKGAWDYLNNTNHKQVLVGVIDTGFAVEVDDLKNVYDHRSIDIVSGELLDNKAERDVKARLEHGTAVAGMIGAESNAGSSIVGVASGYKNDLVKLLCVTTSTYDSGNDDWRFSTTNLIKALNYCAENNVDIINMSIGSYTANSAYAEALISVEGKGIIIVSSAGNDAVSDIHYPSDIEEVISVAAVNVYDSLAPFSCYNERKDICASGDNLNVLTPSGTVASGWNGTSFSSPAACGVIAMMLSTNPNLTTKQIRRIIANTATDLAKASDREKVPYGIINAERAVKCANGYNDNDTFEGSHAMRNNVATNATINVSSELSGHEKRYLNDGRHADKIDGYYYYHYYQSNSNSEQTITIDLKSTRSVDDFAIRYANSFNAQLDISYSNDGKTYYPIYFPTSSYRSRSEYQNYHFDDVDGKRNTINMRYLKLEYSQCSGSIAIYEIGVWAQQYVDRESDIFDPVELPEMPTDFKASKSTNTKAYISWKASGYAEAKGYTYEIKDLAYDRVIYTAGSNVRSVVLDVGRYGFVPLSLTAKYNGVRTESLVYGLDMGKDPALQTTTVAPTTTAQEKVYSTTNLALGKPTKTTSNESEGMNGDKAVDGNMGTRWSSAFENNQWISVDLGSTYKIAKVTINWEAAYAKTYIIQTSMNETSWVTAKIVQNNNELNNEVEIPETSCRYVRIVCSQKATNYGVSIYELGVYQLVDPKTLVQPEDPTFISVRRLAPGVDAVGVIWGETDEMKNAGAKYNVYVDGELKAEKTSLTYLVYSGYTTGEHYFEIKTVLNGVESKGTGVWVRNGEMDDTTTVAPTTVAPTTVAPTTIALQPKNVTYVSATQMGTTNTVGIIWGEDEEMKAAGAVYNVYIDGELTYEKVKPTYYTVNMQPGTHTVRVTTVLNGVESTGVTTAVTINQPTTTTTVLPTTTIAPTTTTPALTPVNVCLGKAATSSSDENGGTKPENAVDGNSGTRWASAFEDNQWIKVDLGAEYTLSSAVIDWEAAYASDYEIQYSMDDVTWNKAATEKITKAGKTTTVLPNVRAKYVRVWCTKRATGYGSSIFELEVYGVPAGVQVTTTVAPTTVAPTTVAPTTVVPTTAPSKQVTNISTGKSAVSSSNENGGTLANMVCDGNMGTRWSSAFNDAEWVYIDLGSVKYVDSVSIIWEAAYGSDYEIQVSDNGQNWTTVKEVLSKGGTDNVTVGQNARYVKMNGLKRATGYGYSIYEMNVMGY